jgi:phosphoglycolate phosphatase-like HAD superfamily hydrolase
VIFLLLIPRKVFMHVCLFDIDGTLIATGGAGKAALEAALGEEFGITRIIDKLQLSGRTDRAIIVDLFRLHVIDDTPENHQRLCDAYLRHLPRYLHSGRVLPGIADLLAHLDGRPDVAVGLLTGNVRAGAKAKLGYFGLYDYFGFGGFGDHHLDRDDVAREALTEVRLRFNGSVQSDRIWVIGDTPLDIRCARSIDARAVAVATGWHSLADLAEHQPDLLLADLSNPAPLLSNW